MKIKEREKEYDVNKASFDSRTKSDIESIHFATEARLGQQG